ncbi:copper resistance protein B [Luteimonas mephitis]|uniref:copper resistance protein B n=1 Tax=Luteimonas mephitis TaxID=83615 RepID=UPI000568F516|nr:copper resistance protein B [Luteimonas mephitis]
MHASTARASAARLHGGLLATATALALLPCAALAQQHDHAGAHAAETATHSHAREPAAAALPASARAEQAAGQVSTPEAAAQMDHAAMGRRVPATPVDHSGMDHAAHAPADAEAVSANDGAAEDHAAMDHATMDHAAMGHAAPSAPAVPAQPQSTEHPGMDHAGMDHSGMDHGARAAAPTAPIEPIPTPTDADRAAAFPPVQGHRMHDNGIHSYVLLDQLEAWDADPGTGFGWAGQSWIGTDLDRVWLRSEGERVDGHTEAASVEVLYGRSVARWWDVVAGIRHDVQPGGSQDFAAIGLIGLAPYKFEVAATAYIGQSGQTAATVEVEYETLLTNRLILQSTLEATVHGRDDARRGIGSGLGTVEAGLRLRYEFTRRFAPYIGVVHERAFGGTADLRRGDGERVDDTRVVAGLRLWF